MQSRLTKKQVDDGDAPSAPTQPTQIGRGTGGEDVVFTNTKPAEYQVEGITIKSEPTDESEPEVEWHGDGETPSQRSETANLDQMYGDEDDMLDAFNSDQAEREEDLYHSSVPPRLVRGDSIATESFAMRGGLGNRDTSIGSGFQLPEPTFNPDAVSNYPDGRSTTRTSAHHGPTSMIEEEEEQTRTSTKRKAPRGVEEADRAVEEAELALLEIQARKRLLAARSARDSLLP